LLLTPLIGATAVPFITFFPAVLFSAWFGGFRAGVLSLAISTVAADYFFVEPAHAFSLRNPVDAVTSVIFVVVGLGMALLSDAQRRAELAERVQRQQMETTLASIGDAVIATDINGVVTFLNPIAESLTGWTQQEAMGQALERVFHIVDEQTMGQVENPALRAMREGVIVGLANHTVLISRKGTVTPIDDAGSPIRDPDGQTVGAVLTFRDISERLQAERQREAAALALRESEERLRITFVSIGDAVLVTDEQGRITHLNPVGERLTGWRESDAVGRPIQDVFVIINEETRQPAPHPVERVLREGVVAGLANHTVLISKAGDEIPIDDSAAPVRAQDGRMLGAVMVFRDITERRQVERERAVSARVTRELAAIVESSDDAIVSKDLDGVITGWNRAAEQMYGYTAADAVGQSIRLIVPDDLLNEEESVLQRIRRGERVEHFETRRRRKDGATLPVSITVSPIRDDTGTVIGASKVARDITARKQIELERATLLEAERAARHNLEVAVQQLQTALHAGRMGTWDYSIAAGKVAWSAGLEQIHGYQPGTFPGTFEAFRDEIHPDDRERVLIAIREAIDQRRDHQVEYRIVRRDGSVRWVEGRGRLLLAENQSPDRMIGVCVDVTDHRQAAEAASRARLAAEESNRTKDEFLAMLSHELRSPLTSILGWASVLRTGRIPFDRASHALEVIERNARLEVQLVESLLDLSRIAAGKLQLASNRFFQIFCRMRSSSRRVEVMPRFVFPASLRMLRSRLSMTATA
jgi:PAS domain S-box-containing protein